MRRVQNRNETFNVHTSFEPISKNHLRAHSQTEASWCQDTNGE